MNPRAVLRFLLAASALLALPGLASAATVTQSCNATIQNIGACAPADAGESGALTCFWASAIDDAPGDPNVASNAVDLRSAICSVLGIPEASCTTAAADGALRRLLVQWVNSYREQRRRAALAALTDPTLDAQGNP